MKKKIFKILFVFALPALRIVDFFDARLFMQLFLSLLRSCGVKLSGSPRYISTTVMFDEFSLISIGNSSVISKNVVLLTHDYSVTTALRAANKAPETDIASIQSIQIGDNVFIGIGSIILPGTKIGDNVIIGAGSVVRGVIPSDSLAFGNPALIQAKCSSRGESLSSRLSSLSIFVDKK